MINNDYWRYLINIIKKEFRTAFFTSLLTLFLNYKEASAINLVYEIFQTLILPYSKASHGFIKKLLFT